MSKRYLLAFLALRASQQLDHCWQFSRTYCSVKATLTLNTAQQKWLHVAGNIGRKNPVRYEMLS